MKDIEPYTLDNAVRDICKVPYAKTNTRKVLEAFEEAVYARGYIQGKIDGAETARIEDNL